MFSTHADSDSHLNLGRILVRPTVVGVRIPRPRHMR